VVSEKQRGTPLGRTVAGAPPVVDRLVENVSCSSKPGAKAMRQLSRTSQFADLARITAQIAGDEFGAAVRKSVKAAWKKVGL
jgi:hypothetical protein